MVAYMYKKVVHKAKNKSKKQIVIAEVPQRNILPKSLSWIGLAPILFIIAFVPLIVYAKIIELSPLEELNWTGGGALQIEFFSYYKALFFVIATIIACVVLIILHFLKVNRIIQSKYYIPMAFYSVFVVISYFFAADRMVASRGFIDMHQGVYVLISYMLVIFVIINLVKNEKHIIAFVYSFIFIGLVVALIGIGQYFGYDIFTTDWGILLTLPKELESIKDEIIVNFGLFGIYATMGNSNFVGSFAALMIPIGFSLYFYTKKYYMKFLAFAFLGLMIFVTYGSNSRAGLVGVVVSVLLSIVLFRKQFFKNPATSITPFVVMIFVGYALNIVTDGKVVQEIKSMDLIAELEALKLKNESLVRFEEISTQGMKLKMKTTDQSVIIEKRLPTIYAYNLNDEPLELIEINGIYTFDDPLYSEYKIKLDASNAFFVITAYGRSLKVYHTKDGLKLTGLGGDLVTAEEVSRLKFLDPYESLFSTRVYIWSRSVPLLLENMIIGAGPDMFAFQFPQNDFAGDFNVGTTYVIFDKPHNMFLQIGINTGVISLLAMISLWTIYILDSLKMYFNRKNESFLDFMGVGMFLSVLAYLSTGFFNDQTLSTAPLFYVILALGIAINQINRHHMSEMN